MVVEWTYNKETRIPDGAEGCWCKSSQVLVVTATHDLETGACAMWLAWNMERVWSMVGLWLCCGREHVVLVGNDNDKNAGCSGGNGVEGVFRRSSDISLMKVAGGNGGTEQWWGGHHRRLRRSHPLIVLRKERDRARTMTHPTLAGLYPFFLGSPARCTFLSYFMFIYMFRIPC